MEEELSIFLNENIATSQDLNLSKVKSLLDLRKTEQVELDDKLQTLTNDTKRILKNCLDETKSHEETLESLQGSLKETMENMDEFIKHSDAPLVKKLSTLEQKLRTIETAKGYIKALLVASELSSQALDLVEKEPDQAMIPYSQLVKFEKYIQQQDQYGELSSYLKKCQIRLWEELNAVLTKNFKETLDTLSWPAPIKPPYGPQMKSKLNAFEKGFRNLLILQQSSEWDPNENPHESILSPISIMLEALSLRFRFHFETSKPTNRIDKPEWYLTHVKNTITTHMPFLMTTIQPILEGTNVLIKDQFIRGLLEDVTRKLQKTMPQLLNHPSWLSHTVHQVLEFDQSLQDEFAYDQSTLLSQVILGNSVWYKAWFTAEKSFAKARYDEIMLDRHAFDIYAEDDLEKSNDNQIKRTKSAVRLMNLLENVTNAYKLVPNITQKAEFLTEIQLNLLGQYHKRLSSAIDSFEALSLIRSVPVPGALPDSVTGVMTATESGSTVSALNRLYRWWTSARCLSDVLKDWNEDEFFLSMQYELNLPENEKYIQRIGESQSEGLFAGTYQLFDQLNKRIEKIMVKVATKEWIADHRRYAKKDTWWQTSTEVPTEISDELYEPLQDLRATWNYLHSILPKVDFLMIYRQTLKEIEDWYWKHIITQSQFSSSGALQLETDVKLGLWKVGQRWVHKPENLTKQLKEAIQLLTLPFSSETTQTDLPSCDVLMKALADPNQSEFVQKTLDKLGIDVLNNTQIRNVLRRRNDMLHSWS